ncbi:methyltransferase domain-containing protein [Fontisphaera persica]|uniref:methyltransferase domain-containing protein n=1 Tax=Fontisphaera persica TaxID=2974023 RepID=UPI0024C086E1|nr:methyltransferase domain-containing protein [Fontisphaera persica]WCJ57816.1 methyltransferase domain-containing protein [Fontisphaera persica]
MRPEHLELLACPECRGDLQLSPGAAMVEGRIERGELACVRCARRYPIQRFIPRFVPSENYAAGFGFEWLQHARTQYDSYTGVPVSEKRFFEETRWPRDLRGERMLEVGCGSGRFTEQAARTGAMVVSIDYSVAVEACHASNGRLPNVLVAQGDIYRLPVRFDFFDKLYCFGVLQHTPQPEQAFMALPRHLKPGGRLAVDVYKRNDSLRGHIGKLFGTKYFVRPLTRRMAPERLYRWVNAYVRGMWPVARVIHRIPRLGRWLNWRLLIADYRGVYPLKEEHLLEWAILDTFDMLSPRYDYPQTLETVRQWFARAGLEEVEVHYGYNGIEGRGRRPGPSVGG